jgi:hypothetical protein
VGDATGMLPPAAVLAEFSVSGRAGERERS